MELGHVNCGIQIAQNFHVFFQGTKFSYASAELISSIRSNAFVGYAVEIRR